MISNIDLLTVAIALTQLTPAFAQDYEITPFIGWRTSDSLEEVSTGAPINLDETGSFGIILSLKKDNETNYDFLFSAFARRQRRRTMSPTAVRVCVCVCDATRRGRGVFCTHTYTSAPTYASQVRISAHTPPCRCLPAPPWH